MRLLLTGDWHITDKTPQNRIDNYWETCKHKISFILEFANKENISYILQPGDFTDSPLMAWSTFIELTNLFNNYPNVKILTVFGQHDLKYRAKGNTTLDAIVATCKNIIISKRIFLPSKEQNVSLYCSSYDEEVPKIISKDETFGILLIHKMVIQNKLWASQTEYVQGFNFVKANKFPLIISGDNHQSFIINLKSAKKYLFNCGSLLRSKIDQINHKPFIIIFDTETRQYEQIMIPIEPAEKVFALEKTSKEKELNENLMAFISGLSEHKEVGLKFEDNLNFYMNENNVKQEIRDIINEAKMEG